MSASNIAEVTQDFCSAGAEALRDYVEVSGFEPLEPPYMPEYFMPASIFRKLGRTRTITLETSLAHLVLWNNATRSRRRHPEEPAAQALQEVANMGSPRVDMVLCDGATLPDRDILELVEFKSGWISFEPQPARVSDRDKLLRILPLVDTCPYGIACGWMELGHLNWQKSKMNGDTLYEAPVPGIFKNNHLYFFGARVFPNPSHVTA